MGISKKQLLDAYEAGKNTGYVKGMSDGLQKVEEDRKKNIQNIACHLMETCAQIAEANARLVIAVAAKVEALK